VGLLILPVGAVREPPLHPFYKTLSKKERKGNKFEKETKKRKIYFAKYF